jgi:hypothetical protein
VAENPEELIEQLLASPQGAVKAAAILERLGAFEPEPPGHEAGGSARSLSDLVRFAYANGQARLVGLPTTPEELAALVAMEGQAAPEKPLTHRSIENPDSRFSRAQSAHG